MSKKQSSRRIIRSSRKGYIPYYFMILVLLGVLAFIKLNNLPLNKNAFIASIVFMVLIIKLTEVHRYTHHYDITPTSLEKVEGFIFRKVKRMNYGSISQLHLTQSPWDKFLNIGTVEISQFSDTIRTEIKNINKPREFLDAISEMMHHKGKYSGDYRS